MKLHSPGKKTTIAGIAAAIIAVAMYCVVTGVIRQWIVKKGVGMLSDRLETVVHLDSVDVSIAQRRLSLYGFTVEDRQRNNMLRVDTMTMKVALMPLFRSRLEVNKMQLHGVTAQLYKERKDTAANYQFVIEAFRKKKPFSAHNDGTEKKKGFDVTVRSLSLSRVTVTWDVRSEARKADGALDANHLRVENASLGSGSFGRADSVVTVALHELRCKEKNSGMALRLSEALYGQWRKDSVTIELQRGAWAWRDMAASFRGVTARQTEGKLALRKPVALHVDSLLYECNNGKPHKRTGKPHRGYFDVGHVNALVNADAVLDYATKDSTLLYITRLAAVDRASGLDIRSFVASLSVRHDTLALQRMTIKLPQTVIRTKEIRGTLLRDTAGKAHDVRIAPFPLTARVVLRDIAKPFAPVLSDFTTPLNLSVTTSGTLAHMDFNRITVTNRDKRLLLTARGDMLDVTKRFDLRLHFRDIRMRANSGIKETIVGHFAKKVRMKMVRQMQKIGDICYRGNVTVAFKREDIDGTLYTKYGNAAFAFTIDGKSKMMTGEISTDSIALGQIMNIKGLGGIKAKADYSFNVASKRKRRQKSKGRLPIGSLNATVEHATFKNIKFRNVSAVMQSDGTTAVGEIVFPKKLMDISLTFMYTQTDSVQDLKFKPKITRHKKNPSLIRNRKKWSEYMEEARERAKKKSTKKEK